MNAKLIFSLSWLAAVALTASPVNAGPRRGGGGHGHGHGHMSMQSRGGATFSRGGNRSGRNWSGRNWSGQNWSGGNQFIFTGGFGVPYYGYGSYPYGYYNQPAYGYGYYGNQGYGYGNGNQGYGYYGNQGYRYGNGNQGTATKATATATATKGIATATNGRRKKRKYVSEADAIKTGDRPAPMSHYPSAAYTRTTLT